MAELRLTYQELKRYSAQLTPEQFEAGIERIGSDQPKTSTQLRWELMGHHIILAKVKLYCLQDLHITLAGYDAISDASITSVYQALYHRLVAQLPRMMTTTLPDLQTERVDRLLGFIRFVHPGLLSQFISQDVLKSSVRRLLPADEMLRRYVKKNGGIMQRTVTPTTEGSHVRLIYRMKDAVGTGRSLNDAVAMASERMADILYDGDLPTVHDAFPQQPRRTVVLNANMRTWGKPFDVSDDLIGRILGFDQANASMDRLIESIGANLAAVDYFNRDLKLISRQDAGQRLAQYIDHIASLPKVAAAPYVIPLGQSHPAVKHAIVYRMFFYLNTLGMAINPEFEKFLRSDDGARSESRRPEAAKIKIKASERVVTPVFKPESSKTGAQPQPLQQTPITKPKPVAETPSPNIHPESKPTQPATVSPRDASENVATPWANLGEFNEMINWVKQTTLPYTTLLSPKQNPITMFQKVLKPQQPVTLTIVLPQLDRQKLKVVAPLISSVQAIAGSHVTIFAGNVGGVLEEQPVGDITPMTMLALLKHGVQLRQMDTQAALGQLIELNIDDQVIDYLVAGDITNIGTTAQQLPGQVTVSATERQPLGWWTKRLRVTSRVITAEKLSQVLLDNRLKTLGF